MNGMDFAMDQVVCGNGVPVPWRAAAADDEAGHAEDACVVVFQMMRGGVLKTEAGAIRIAAVLEIQRRDAGRLVAVLLVAALTGQGSWTVRRFSVPMELERPADAAKLLGALLPDVLTRIPDGALLMCGEDGVVRAEVLSRSGRRPQAGTVEVEVDLRRAGDRPRRGRGAVGGASAQQGLHA